MSELYDATFSAVRSKISGGDIGQAFADAARQALDCNMHDRVGGALTDIVWEFAQVAIEQKRPSTIYRPSIGRDGNQWCALYGENLMEGVAGFGDSPAEAMTNFDANWIKALA